MTGPKKNRKADFETIKKILDDNEYHPLEISIDFDKNFWKYRIILSNPKEQKMNYWNDMNEPLYINSKKVVSLYRHGFQIFSYYAHFSVYDDFSGYPEPNTKLKNINIRMKMLIVRSDELDKALPHLTEGWYW